MATTPTKTGENNLDQSVYVADQDTVRTYPREISNDEIDYDVHINVRKKSPEDYFLNFLPTAAIQKGFKDLIEGVKPIDLLGPGVRVAREAIEFEQEKVQPAFKMAIAGRPDLFFATPKQREERLQNNPVTPEQIAIAYKPWLEIWRESPVGKKIKGYNEKLMVDAPAPVAFVPWFVSEFVPSEMLEFGTKATSWVGAYGIEKFGPPLIHKTISKLPENFRSILLKDIFAGEKALAADFETLGIKINARTSEVVNAYKKGARVAHPDAGGSPEEFAALNQAYRNIMAARSGVMDKLFDFFRSPELAAKPEAKIAGFLGNERGSALIPFSEGDVVKIGKSIGQVIKISGKVATVNLAGKISDLPLEQLTAIPQPLSEESAVNLKHLQVSDEAKYNLRQATDALAADIQNQAGKPLTHEEIIQASKEAEILKQGVSRESTLQFEASLLKTRQHLAALAQQDELTPEFLDTLKIIADTGTDIARSLESMKIDAMPEFASVKVKVVKDLIKLGKTTDEIMEASKGVDWQSEQSVAKFYRKFVEPTLSEMLDEFSYINILSSPLTHIVNATSNAVQLAGLNPLTKLATGGMDFLASNMTGKERNHYISEVPAFYKGALNAFPDAFGKAVEIMKGNKTLERPDLQHIPTLSKLVDWGTLKIGKYVLRALEASDIFFRTMVEAGEIEALSKALGHAPDAKEMSAIQKEAAANADYYVFRSKPDADNATGQGKLLSAIDNLTNAIYRLRSVPGLKWFIRFVQTPMNILKQGIEYSPAGIATLPGAEDKTEQAAKVAIGSLVFAGASWLAANGQTTWSPPSSEREKNEFFAAGLQPYSVRIGDNWVSYSKIGPLAYPLAMASALHYFTKESPNALSDSDMDKVVDAMTGLMRFFSDQSYLQGVGDIVSFARGEKMKAIANIPTQLIPLSSLQGWVNNIMDQFQRKPAKGLSIESIVDQIQMKIIGMSRFVPPQLTAEEMPVRKQMREVNAFSPLKVSTVDEGALSEFIENRKIKQEINLAKKESQ